MPTDVVMPQMGESVTEGTIVRWIKKVGDTVDKDEPLFEISTDKVDAEIPSPGVGVLLAIHVAEGDTVAVNTVVAQIGTDADRGATTSGAKGAKGAKGAEGAEGAKGANGATGEEGAQGAPSHRRTVAPPHPPSAPSHLRTSAPPAPFSPGVIARRRTRSSPVVRRIAEEHAIDISRLTGTGISGRVTRQDIEALVSERQAPRGRVIARPPAYAPGDNVRIEKMSVMRRKIAEHMVLSAQTSPHVYSTYEVDFGRVDELRRKHKARYEAAGTKLTYTVFIARATADAIRECPFANASVDGENVVYKEDINLGIAVALEQGLIVPVIRTADKLSVMDLARAVQDLADRARSKHLKVEEVQGGTFTITNPGVFGATFGLPIISQPQVAILAVGSIDKRAVVRDDQIVVRPMSYFTLGHDHRLIDGAEGARFLSAVKRRLETFDEALL
jgi:pyruvate dehydrogenase E2 component (dihydrolipoamide acetyltransferase)